MKLTLAVLSDIGDQMASFLENGLNMEEADCLAAPVTICRYNTEQVIDRIVIQVRGEVGVTIHTADAGVK